MTGSWQCLPPWQQPGSTNAGAVLTFLRAEGIVRADRRTCVIAAHIKNWLTGVQRPARAREHAVLALVEVPVATLHDEPGQFPWWSIDAAGERLLRFAHRFGSYDWSSESRQSEQERLLETLKSGESDAYPAAPAVGFLTCDTSHLRGGVAMSLLLAAIAQPGLSASRVTLPQVELLASYAMALACVATRRACPNCSARWH